MSSIVGLIGLGVIGYCVLKAVAEAQSVGEVVFNVVAVILVVVFLSPVGM